MKKGRTIAIALAAVLVAAGISLVTYARYANNELGGNGSVSVAKWNVSVTDGTTEQSATQGVTFNVTANENVSTGYMAPGSTATAQLVLDPTGSQVAIDYTISITETDLQAVGMSISSVTAKIGSSPVTLTNTNGVYSGNLTLSQVEAGANVTFTVVVQWVNNEANNATDTQTGIAAQTITIPVTVTAKQHIS